MTKEPSHFESFSEDTGFLFPSEEQWKQAFKEMDADGSGELTIDELYEGLRKAGCGMSKEEVMRIVDTVDSSKDRRLTYNEFKELMRL